MSARAWRDREGRLYEARRWVSMDGELVDVIDTRTVREAVRWARSDIRAGIGDEVLVTRLHIERDEVLLVAIVTSAGVAGAPSGQSRPTIR